MEKACFHSTAGHCLGPAPPPPCLYPPASSQHGAALETDGHRDTYTQRCRHADNGVPLCPRPSHPCAFGPASLSALPLFLPPFSLRLQFDPGASSIIWERACASASISPPSPSGTPLPVAKCGPARVTNAVRGGGTHPGEADGAASLVLGLDLCCLSN